MNLHKHKILYDDSSSFIVDNITPYIAAGKSVLVQPQKKPLSHVPNMIAGNKTVKCLALILSPEERATLISRDPKAEKYITQTSHMKNMSFPHNHTALSNKHYQAADFCSALRIYSGSLLTKSCAITCSCLSVAWNTVLILASITSCKIIMDCWNVTSAISFTIR